MLKFFFSVFIILHSIILYLNFEKKAKNKFISILKVFIFYLALSCFVSYLILFNLKHHQISVIVFAIYFLSTFLIYRIDFKNFSKNLKNFFQQSKYSDFIILIYLLVAFFYINLPPIDVDSIRYHLLIGKKISLNEFYNNITLDYVYLSYSELISYIGQIFYSNNIISLFNFFGLVIVYILNKDLKKNHKLGFGNHSTIIIFSILYLLSNLYSQKLYFLLCVLSVYSLIYVLIKNTKIDYTESLIFLSGNLFCFLGKYSFALIITINIFFIFYKLSKQNKYYFIFSSVILFCILYFPIFLIKLRLFNEPFLPFIVINENNKFLSEFLKYTYNYGANLNEIFNIEFYKNYFSIQNFISPSNLIGIAFITIFFSIKRNIFTLSLILYLISILLIGNLQSRWFIPAVILSSMIYVVKNNIINNLIKFVAYSQIFIQIVLMFFFNMEFFFNNKSYMKKYFHAYNLQKYIEKNYINFIPISDSESDYYFKNHISLYKYNIISSVKNKTQYQKIIKGKYYIIATKDKKKLDSFVKNYFNRIKILDKNEKIFNFSERNLIRKYQVTYYFLTFLAL